MQWIKDENNLPTSCVYGKFKGYANREEIKSGMITPLKNGIFNFSGSSFFYTGDKSFIFQWLDETETPEPTGSGWIENNDVPKIKGKRFLTFNSNGSYDICYINEHDIWISIYTGIQFTKLITHYCLLPLPPKP